MPKPPKIILLSPDQGGRAVSEADVSLHGARVEAVEGFSGYLKKTDDAAEMIPLLTVLTALTTAPPESTNGGAH